MFAVMYLFTLLTWFSDRDEFSFPLELQKTLSAEKKPLQVSSNQPFSSILAFAINFLNIDESDLKMFKQYRCFVYETLLSDIFRYPAGWSRSAERRLGGLQVFFPPSPACAGPSNQPRSPQHDSRRLLPASPSSPHCGS